MNKSNEKNKLNSIEKLNFSIEKLSNVSNTKPSWDKVLKFVPFFTLCSTILISIFTIIISSGNFEVVKIAKL